MRTYTSADLADVVALHQAWDTHFFGHPEHDESEVLEDIERLEHSLLLHDDDRLVAAAWWWGNHTTVVVDLTVDTGPLYDVIVPWLVETGAHSLESLDRDTDLLAALQRHGWRHDHSGFELIRSLEDWVPENPVWPDDVRLTGIDDPAAAHELLYEHTGWLDVIGHLYRPLDEWQSLFLNDTTPPEQQVALWQGDLLVGIALTRLFSDGGGWVPQIAVRNEFKGRGLGRQLLLEAFQRQVAAGASTLGLGVSATNRDALRLYLSVGLTVEREWLAFMPT